jgi:hypothetical protein
MAAPTPVELFALARDEAFTMRVTVAFAGVIYALLTVTTKADPEIRKKQLEAIRKLSAPDKLKELTLASMSLVIGAPEVQVAGAAVTDPNLAVVVGKIAEGLSEYAALGGTL